MANDAHLTGAAPTPPPEQSCPACGRPMPVGAPQCPGCGVRFKAAGGLGEPRQPSTEAIDFIVPVKHNIWAILCFYLGLFATCMPICGVIFAVPGTICGIIALRQWKKEGTYSAVTSNLRTVAGLILCTLGFLLTSAVVAYLLTPRDFWLSLTKAIRGH